MRFADTDRSAEHKARQIASDPLAHPLACQRRDLPCLAIRLPVDVEGGEDLDALVLGEAQTAQEVPSRAGVTGSPSRKALVILAGQDQPGCTAADVTLRFRIGRSLRNRLRVRLQSAKHRS